MKLATTLLVAGLLFTTAPAVGAADEAAPILETAPPSQASPAEVVGAEGIAAFAGGCQATDDPSLASDGQDATPASDQYCGACSTSNCDGAARGQMCWTGSAWGNCNIFSGGHMCSTGGWECQCSTGDLQ